jgi:hypothetical protein
MRGLLPVLFGSVIGLQGWLWASDANAFIENLRETEGRVTRMERSNGELQLDVEYLDETGVRYTKQLSVDAKMENEIQQVGKVSMVYDLHAPQIASLGHVVSANNERLLYTVVTAIGILLCLFGLWIFIHQILITLGRIALLNNGRICQTEIRDSIQAPGKQKGRFTFAFRGPDGRWYEGKSEDLPLETLAEWPVGKPIVVAYDALHPHRSEVDLFGAVDSSRFTIPAN